MLRAKTVQCPYCWEQIEIMVDPTLEEQDYIEDCSVCCSPIHFKIQLDEYGHPQVQALSENEDY